MLRLLLSISLAHAAPPNGMLNCDLGAMQELAARRAAKAAGLGSLPLNRKQLLRADQVLEKITSGLEADPMAQLASELARAQAPRVAVTGGVRESDGVMAGKRFAVFAGDFDPPNQAQVRAVEKAVKQLGLDEVLLVPAKKGLHSPAEQAEFVRTMFARVPQARVPSEALSAKLEALPYSRSVEWLAGKNPSRTVVSLTGEDALKEAYFGAIPSPNVRYAVISRTGDANASLTDDLISARRLNAKVDRLDSEGNLSSDSIRAALARGEAPEGLPPGYRDELVPTERIDVAEVRITQSAVGQAQVNLALEKMGKKAANFGDLRSAITKFAEKDLPAVKGPDLWGRTEAQIYITDGHHGADRIYQLLHGSYEELPGSIRKVMTRDQQRLLAHDSAVELSVRIEKRYLSLDEMVHDFARTNRGLLPETVEKNPLFSPVLAKARSGEPLTEAESKTLLNAYRHISPDFARVKDDPVRAAVGVAFKKAGLDGANMKDYAEFLVARGNASEAIRALGITGDNALSGGVQKGLKKILFDDPEAVKSLRALARDGSDKNGVPFSKIQNDDIDAALAKRARKQEKAESIATREPPHDPNPPHDPLPPQDPPSAASREPTSLTEPRPHESDLTAHLDLSHPDPEELKLRDVNRELLDTIRNDKKGEHAFSYVVDEENKVHAVEGKLKFGEGRLRIATEGERNFLVKEAGDILYDAKTKKFSFKSDYALDLTKAEHDLALADLKAKVPAEMLAKPASEPDYAKVVDCTAALNDQLSGSGDALTRTVMRNVAALGFMGVKELDVRYRYSDDPEKLANAERKMWTSFLMDVPRRTIGAYSASLVGKPLIDYGVNPYLAFGARWVNGAVVNYGAKEAMDFTTAYFTPATPGAAKKKESSNLSPQDTRNIMYYNDTANLISPLTGGIADRAALNNQPMKAYENCVSGKSSYVVGPRMVRVMESGVGMMISIPKYWLWGI